MTLDELNNEMKEKEKSRPYWRGNSYSEEDLSAIAKRMQEERIKEDESLALGLCPECGNIVEEEAGMSLFTKYYTCKNTHIFVRTAGKR